MAKRHDISGKRYGRLLVKEFSHKTKNGNYWICICDCGKTVTVLIQHLNNGHTRSCKCLNNELAKSTFTKHGKYTTPEYRAWIGMKTRCYNPSFRNYHNWGGRGIKVCPRWLNSFENFLSDIGEKPFAKASLDRVDNNGDYTPENCRWTSRSTQNSNRRKYTRRRRIEH